VDAKRAPILHEAGTLLRQANIPAYASIYKTPFRGNRIEQGAMLVAAVGNRGETYERWMQNIGQNSVGFITGHSPSDGGTGSGHLRVGKTFISYSDLNPSSMLRRRVGNDISTSTSDYTEATFLSKPAETQAIMAFYQARANGLIVSPGPEKARSQARLPKDVVAHLPSEGGIITPTWNASKEGSGSRMKTLQTDACAGRASSVLNPNWRKAFAWNVKYRLNEIKAYGQQNNIPELANLTPDAAKHLDRFMQRYFGSGTTHKQSNDPHAVVRKNAIHASMVTTFNSYKNPIKSLKWGLSAQKYKGSHGTYVDQSDVRFYQPGQGQLYVLPDWKPGQKQAEQEAARTNARMFSPPRFDSERVPLNNFMQQLGSNL